MSDVDAGWPDGEGPLRRELPVVAASDDEALIVDVAGFEGPLDLLLELARARRSISSGSRSWRLPSNISPSSPRRGSSGSSLPPTTWSWRRGSPI